MKTNKIKKRLHQCSSFLERQLPHQKPDFVVLGAQKCGTTALYHCLAQHPRIRMPRGKEETHYFDKHYWRGDGWYLNHFPIKPFLSWGDNRRLAVGDSTPCYIFTPAVSSKLYRLLPDAKFLVLLRDPVERALSHYFHSVRKGHENLDPMAAFDAEVDRLAGERERIVLDPYYYSQAYNYFSYRLRGLYRDQIDAWLEYFPLERFQFLRSDRFSQAPQETMDEVWNFLGLASARLHKPRRDNTGAWEAVDNGLVAQLQEYYEEPNRRLAELLGEEFDFNAYPGPFLQTFSSA